MESDVEARRARQRAYQRRRRQSLMQLTVDVPIRLVERLLRRPDGKIWAYEALNATINECVVKALEALVSKLEAGEWTETEARKLKAVETAVQKLGATTRKFGVATQRLDTKMRALHPTKKKPTGKR